MLAVTAAMIVPSISTVSGSLEDESKRLQLVMRYALEEAQLSGFPIRWRATKDGWSFEAYVELAQDKQAPQAGSIITWQPLEEKPLESYRLPEGVFISQVEQAGEFFADSLLEDNRITEKGDKEPTIGLVLLLPDGTTSQSNVYLQDEDENTSILEIRPGPAGVRLKKEGE